MKQSPHPDAPLRVILFGKPRLTFEGQPLTLARRKALALFIYLVMNPYPHGRDLLAALLWPEFDQAHARAGLRRALAELNKTPLRRWLAAETDSVGLAATAGLWADVVAFNQSAGAETDHTALQEAAGLYHDHFLAGFSLPDSVAFDDWQAMQTQLLQQKMTHVLLQLAEHYATSGDTENGLDVTKRLMTHDPYHEHARVLYMQMLALSGQRAAALRAYESYAALMQRELEATPQPETQRVYEAIK